jgi:beta-lactam-binding protein with PASTA domain
MSLLTAVVFFVSFTPEDQVLVPNVTNMSIVDALVILQHNNLYPKITIRNTDDLTLTNNTVIQQIPNANTWIRGNREVSIVIYKLIPGNIVPNFIGKSLDEVRQEILITYKNIVIREPLIYVNSNDLPNKVINQSPIAGSKFDGNILIELTLSKGSLK